MAIIKATRHGCTIEVTIDDRDLQRVSKHRWYVNKIGYVVANVGRKMIYLHRLILNAKKGEVVDHRSGNTFDARRSNLRKVTKRQNCANRANLHPANTSGHRGVSFCKQTKRWKAVVKINFKQHWLGRFDTVEQAAAAAKAYRLANMPGALS
jgi:hypothetical protein